MLDAVEGALAAAGRIEPLPRRVVHGHAEQGQHGGEHGLELAVEGEDLGVNLLAHHPRVVARLDVEVSLEQIGDGQVGRALAVGGRAALEEQPAFRAAGMSELPAQARFAHTGLAHHGHHLPVPGLRQVERLLELIQLDVTAHEGGQAPRGRGVEPGAHGARPEELEYFHRIRESLDGEGAARLHLDVSLGELPGARREENRPRLGHLLEARGQMRGLSHRGVIHAQIAADGPHHHLARVEPHADPRRDVVGAHHLARVASQRFLHAEGGIAGPHRVILVGHRRAEESHDAVAHHLVDRALVAMHGFDHELQHRIEEPLRLLGIAVGESSSDPRRSAKSTVTCLRSPSRALLEVRIFSARCLGVYDSGERKRWGPTSGVAHCPQKRWLGGLAAPQVGHMADTAVPHCPQKRVPAGLSAWHRGQFIPRCPSPRAKGARKNRS